MEQIAKPELFCWEMEEPVTALSISFKGPSGKDEESINVYFFPEAETPEEAERQRKFRLRNNALEIGSKHVPPPCETCELAKKWALVCVFALAVAYVSALYGAFIFLFGAFLLALPTYRWHIARDERERRKLQREWLRPIEHDLYACAKRGDFSSAMKLACAACSSFA